MKKSKSLNAFVSQNPKVKNLTSKQTTKVVGGNGNGATGFDIIIVWVSDNG